MTTPARRLAVFSALVTGVLIAASLSRTPRHADDTSDLRDAVSDHAALLRAGHSSLSCASCHFAHPASSPRPLWQAHGGDDPALFARDSQRAGGAKSNLCMSCHDGAIASGSQVHGGPRGGATSASLGSDPSANHPVGVDYLAALRRDPGSYNDPASNPRIVLEEGKVGCLSCHAAHDVGAVSAGDVRQEVCIECHRR